MEIAGSDVLLTGATGGLGREIARQLADSGARLVLTGRSEEALQELADGLPGPEHSVVAADLGEPGATLELAERAAEVDVLVANAGLPGSGRLDDLTPEQVARMLRVNLESPVLLSQALLPGMLERGRGKLVLIGSLAGKVGSPRSSIYNATKFGLRGFVFGLKPDLVKTGVDVTLVAPGFVRDAGMFADTGADSPLGMGTTTPDRVAEAVARAIEGEQAEISVAPVMQRAVAYIAQVSPPLAYLAQKGDAGQKAADQVTSRQVEKR